MKATYNKKGEHEPQDKELSAKVNALNNLVVHLRKEINEVMEKFEQKNVTELFENINHLILKQEEEKSEINRLQEEILQLKELVETINHVTLKQEEEKSEINRLQEEILQLKEHIKLTNQTQDTNIQLSPKQSEFRQLQNMLKSSRHIEQVSTKKK